MSSQAEGQNAAFEPNRLKQAANERYLTLPALARELEVAEKTVYRWNKGETPPRLDNVRRISELLERDPAWFYGERAA